MATVNRVVGVTSSGIEIGITTLGDVNGKEAAQRKLVELGAVVKGEQDLNLEEIKLAEVESRANLLQPLVNRGV